MPKVTSSLVVGFSAPRSHVMAITRAGYVKSTTRLRPAPIPLDGREVQRHAGEEERT